MSDKGGVRGIDASGEAAPVPKEKLPVLRMIDSLRSTRDGRVLLDGKQLPPGRYLLVTDDGTIVLRVGERENRSH
ncbi:hypothetical protein SAMN05421505_10161 [Sinosporangium album]|uniref:Uncharacterized protein n=1 Tax=Sinosporangium album TaxID=504805 RepID=A0A1G7QNR4_9ACTN|nr:hypothetical protein [Sinosporangium album]SDG00124.1 hypothetical protein SAMN05421505_10161 [Sinosporangium album]